MICSMIAQFGLAAVQTGLNMNDPTIVQGIVLAYGLGEAVSFWERMSSGKQGEEPPQFLSTHPSGDTRIQQLRQWMPEALQHYHGRQS